MIGADKARFFPSSRGNKRSMVSTHIMKSMNLPIFIPAHQKLHFSNSATLNPPFGFHREKGNVQNNCESKANFQSFPIHYPKTKQILVNCKHSHNNKNRILNFSAYGQSNKQIDWLYLPVKKSRGSFICSV